MKKTLYLVLTIILIAWVSFFLANKNDYDVRFDEFLLQNSVLMVRGKSINEFNIQLQKFCQIDKEMFSFLQKVYRNENLFNVQGKCNKFLKKITDMHLASSLSQIPFSINLLNIDVDDDNETIFYENNILLTAKIDNLDKALFIVNEIFGVLKDRQTRSYLGKDYKILKYDDFSIYYFFYNDNYIFSFNENIVKYTIGYIVARMFNVDFSGNRIDDIREHLLEDTSNQDIVLYINFDLAEEVLFPVESFIKDNTGILFKALSLSFRPFKDEHRWLLSAILSPKHWKDFSGQYQLNKPGKQLLDVRAVKQPLFFFWTNWFKIKHFWYLGFEQSLPDVKSLMATVSQRWSELTGTQFETIFSLLGDEFGMFIHQHPKSGQPNRNTACLLFQITEPQKLKNLLKRLFADIQAVTVVSEGREIVSIILAGGLLQPAYSIGENYLLFADSVSLIEEVQRHLDAGGISSDKTQIAFSKNNFSLSLYPKLFIEHFTPIIALVNGDTGNSHQNVFSGWRNFFQEFIVPWFQSMKSEQSLRIQGNVDNGVLRVELVY